jgi:hypothetical protein
MKKGESETRWSQCESYIIANKLILRYTKAATKGFSQTDLSEARLQELLFPVRSFFS